MLKPKKSPYPGFTKLWKRRMELFSKWEDKGNVGTYVTTQEWAEMQMLDEICRLMIQFRWPKQS